MKTNYKVYLLLFAALLLSPGLSFALTGIGGVQLTRSDSWIWKCGYNRAGFLIRKYGLKRLSGKFVRKNTLPFCHGDKIMEGAAEAEQIAFRGVLEAIKDAKKGLLPNYETRNMDEVLEDELR